jgi:glycine cleavage system H protein
MKEISDLNLPSELHYSNDHGWVRMEGDLAVIGITDYAQDQLGDVVYVGLPEVGSAMEGDQEYGSVESVKTVSELLMPLAGTVVEINGELEDSPELVNSEPYGAGWLIKLKPEDPGRVDELMDREAYLVMISG